MVRGAADEGMSPKNSPFPNVATPRSNFYIPKKIHSL